MLASQNRTIADPPTGIAAAPDWFPHALDLIGDRVLLVRRTEAELRTASFLDDRSVPADATRAFASWHQLGESLGPDARHDLQYIFHIGHVGSTLISRLLDVHPQILGLREPAVLRTLFEIAQVQERPENPWDPSWLASRTAILTSLLSRTYRADQRVLLKATSFTSELAPQLVPAGSAALLIYASPQRYIENILAGDASKQELHQLAGRRLARLSRRLGEMPVRLWELNEGRKAALAWACEMLSMEAAARELPPAGIRWCDFDRFLADAPGELVATARFFGHDMDRAAAEQLCAGPVMHRYSKAPEYEYSPGLREQILTQSRRENREAIADAMDWLAGIAAAYPPIAAALNRAR